MWGFSCTPSVYRRASVSAAGARSGGGRHICSARTRALTRVAVNRRRRGLTLTSLDGWKGARCHRSWLERRAVDGAVREGSLVEVSK